MDLRLHSDTHLEGFIGCDAKELADKFFPIGANEFEQVLILAGDICSVPEKTNLVFQYLSRRFKHIIYVPGNHEYYKSSISEQNEKFKSLVSNFDNIIMPTDNQVGVSVIDGVRFIYSTLWTDPFAEGFNPEEIEFYLADFRAIRDFSLDDMAEIHFNNKRDLFAESAKPFDGKTVIVTHHMPSFSLCHPRFGNTLNHGFASNCEHILHSGNVDLWCFGHTHDFISTSIGKTQVRCNPTGYRGEWNRGFCGGSIFNFEV